MTDSRPTDETHASLDASADDARLDDEAEAALDAEISEAIDEETEAEIEATIGAHAVPPAEAPPPPAAAAAVATPAAVAPAQRGGRALAALALLIALAAGAGAGYTWWTQQQASAQLTSAQATVENARTAISEGLQSFNARSKGLSEDVEALRSRITQSDNAQTGLRTRVEDLAGTLDRYGDDVDNAASLARRAEQSVNAMRGMSDSARRTWARAEIEFFLQTANTRLRLAGDSEGALAALEAADDRLLALDDPALTDVRGLVADEIVAVSAVPDTDIQGLALTLGSLAGRVDLLPLAGRTPPDRYDTEGATEATGESGVDRALSAVGGALSEMFRVRRSDEEVAPLLAPKETFFLYRNLELQLQIARYAALKGDAGNFAESLRAARDWLDAHFDGEDSGVASAKATLDELASYEVDPPLPDISGSLDALRRAPLEG